MSTYTLVNLIPNPSFETVSGWSGITYDDTKALYGGRSSCLPTGTTQVNTITPSTQPVLGHIYYGRHSILTAGNSTPSDGRFEWYAGDGEGLNWVFGRNEGNHPDWHAESARQTISAINGSNYIIRNFADNATFKTWCDGFMLIDLTEAFGAGNEPDKEFCDRFIPFFEGSYSMTISASAAIMAARFTPSAIDVGTPVLLSVNVAEVQGVSLPAEVISGEFVSWEV